MPTLKTKSFDLKSEAYDQWFDRHSFAFQSEVEALREQLPDGDCKGIEVGVGSGRFSIALGIKEGVEPAANLGRMARARGIDVFRAPAERLPYKDLRYDFVLMPASIHYFTSVATSFREAWRVLKPGGRIIVGFIDTDSLIGKAYEAERQENAFYKEATFFTPEKIQFKLKSANFRKITFTQALFRPLDEIDSIELSKPGFGEGSFVVAMAFK